MGNKLWGGRFGDNEMNPWVMEFTSSIDVDKILAEYDCKSTIVHVKMLNKSGYMTNEESKAVISVLEGLLTEIAEGKIEFDNSFEDIHSAIQAYVEEKEPDAGKKMHTGRSRNEQVVNDVRLYCKDAAVRCANAIGFLQNELVHLAERTQDIIIPGYTHLQHAQPILFAHLILAYVEMIERDKQRVEEASVRADVSVMGSGAIAGSALEIDRAFVAEELGFSAVSSNSIDAVSDRDFMVELVSALSLMGVHLSRISEDMIIYGTSEFAFLKLGDEYCTGSSLMPQKKNFDVLELIRGRSANMIGALNSLLILLKGLPHAYNRDLQEDKKFLFETVELAVNELTIMAGLVKTIEVDKKKALAQLEDEFLFATDLAEYLVRKGVAFKEAHGIIGAIVKSCQDNGTAISALSLSEIKAFSEVFEKDVFEMLNPETSVKNKKTIGGTNPEMVKKEISVWKNKLGKDYERVLL